MLPYPQIDPVAISVGPLQIHWYGLMYLIGIGGALLLESLLAFLVHKKPPDAPQKAADALDPFCAPRLGVLQRPHEHFVHPKSIGTEFFNNVIRINDISPGFTHFFAVFSENHTLINQFFERLFCGDYACIIKYFMPKTGVKQMQYGMFCPAHI